MHQSMKYKWILTTNKKNMKKMAELLDEIGIDYHFQEVGKDSVRLGVERVRQKEAHDALSGDFVLVDKLRE